MICCEHCRSARFLHVEGEIMIDDETGEVVRVILHFECTRCGLDDGEYRYLPGEETVRGSIVVTDERQQTSIDAMRGVDA